MKRHRLKCGCEHKSSDWLAPDQSELLVWEVANLLLIIYLHVLRVTLVLRPTSVLPVRMALRGTVREM